MVAVIVVVVIVAVVVIVVVVVIVAVIVVIVRNIPKTTMKNYFCEFSLSYRKC
uniref:Bm13045 n=1 Tax=Brugia malayi TaxID=6279 RepID=A0A1I9G0N4_BRUMA|nr:Bm13045 [Brugia malayi]